MDTVDFKVTFKGTTIPFEKCDIHSSVISIKEHLEATTQIPLQAQKLIWKGRLLQDDQTLASINLTDNTKLTMIGSSVKQLEAIAKANEQLAARQKLKKIKPVTLKKPAPSPEDLKYSFQRLSVLNEFPQAHQAKRILERLRDDFAVKAIMKKRKWSVGELKELTPFEQSILGYNKNAGELIALRLRTDDLSGFRHYDSIRKVLLHELTHNVWSDHDENFHALNRQLNEEVHTRGSQNYRTYRLSNDTFYTPEDGSTTVWQGGRFRLGGPSTSQPEPVIPLPLTRQEESEMDQGCGTKHS